MKILAVSDLHVERRNRKAIKSFVDSFSAEGVDVLVIAGDLGEMSGSMLESGRLARTLKLLCAKFKHVVMVCGNHEFYGGIPRELVLKAFRDYQVVSPNFHFLENDVVVIDGQRFVGTTMWFEETPGYEKLLFTDFEYTEDHGKWIFEANRVAKQFLRDNMQKGDIVVTHHLPCHRSIDPWYADSKSNVFYLCEMTQDFMEKDPQLWIHGHTHSSNDYVLGDTRVVSNPYGYYMVMVNHQFDHEKVLELI